MTRPVHANSGVTRGVVTLGAGEALSRVVSFLATVYLARRLGADLYGVVALAMAIMAYVGRVADCGIDWLGVHDVATSFERLPAYLADYSGARVLVAAILAIIVAAIGLFWFPNPDGAILAAFAFVSLPVALGTRWAHLGLENAGLVSISRTLGGLATGVLLVLFVRRPSQVGLVPVAHILGEAAASYVLLRALPRSTATLSSILRLDVVNRILRRSWSLVLNGLLGLVIFNSDIFFIRIYSTAATVGFYAVAYFLVSFFMNLGHASSQVLVPTFTRALDDPSRLRALYHTATAQAMAVALPVALGGALVADRLIPAVFGGGYVPAVIALQVLIWCLPIAILRNVLQSVFIALSQQDVMLKTSLVAAACNVALNVTLIPFFGMAGAAFATVVTEAVRTIPMLLILRGAGLLIAPAGRFWRTATACAAMGIAVVLIPLGSVWLVIGAGAASYVLTMYLAGGISFRSGRLPELRV